ncbi:MAG: thioredoxin domain-containing protein [Sphingomonadales bacterium]
MTKNRLKNETSPYLLQHEDNPVHWWPWGDEAFARAKKENKPVLLSVGYAACHWCHVMAHESFEDEATAALMNKLFINIKVDREERPDVDVIYQRALNMMGQQGGWPLTIFLDAKGQPFWGGTYFPGEPRQGMPAFRNVLEQISNAYKGEPVAIGKNRTALMEGLERAWAIGAKEEMKPSVFFGAIEMIKENMDPEAGGMKGAPKFPNMPLMKPLWAASIRKSNNNLKLNYLKTMTMICQGGIYDHLGGGFCRYSTDAYWLAPHFEKMLYDNALIIEGLVEAWKETKSPLFRARIKETIGWLEREMKMPGGAFAASLDADSEGEEGKFYVWTRDEIEKVLGQSAGPLIRHYGVEPAGNWEGKTILHRLFHSEEFNKTEEKKLDPLKTKLLIAREKRPRPFLDDKILSDWNGLLISGLVSAWHAFKNKDWIKLAENAFNFIFSNLQKEGRLHHSWREEKLGPVAYLDDYAAMVGAATALYSATGKPEYLTAAEAWMKEAQENLEDKKFGGYFLSAEQKPALIARPKTIHDQATPSGNGLMIENLTALYQLTGKEEYRTSTEALLLTFAGAARVSPFASGTYFSGYDAARFGAHLFIKGKRSAKPVQALLAVASDLSFPGLVVQVEEKVFPLPAAKALKEGQAIVCQGTTCSLPVESAKDLKKLLIGLRQIKED